MKKCHWMQRQNRVYPTLEAAVASRTVDGLPIGPVTALVEQPASCAGGYTWTTGLRLRGASAGED